MSNTPEAKFDITATDKTKAAFRSVDKQFGILKKRLFSVNTVIAGVVGVGGLGALITSQITARKEVTSYANALKMSNQQLEAWGYATETVSIKQEKLADIFKDVSEKIGDAYRNEGGEAVEILESLGLKTAELVKLKPDEQLLKIAEQLDNVGTQAEKVQILEGLASDASLLLPLLENDAEKLKELKKEAIDFGVAITDIDAAKLKAANDAFFRTEQLIKGFGTKIAIELAQPIEEVGKVLTQTFVGNDDDIKNITQTIVKTTGTVLVSAGELWDGFNNLPDWAQNVGILGALLGGKKGVILLGALAHEAKRFETIGGWWDAYSNDKIGFTEWFTTGHEEAKVKLDELKKQGIITTNETVENGENKLKELGERLKNLDFSSVFNPAKGSESGDGAPQTISGFDPITAFNEEAAAKFEALEQSILREDERLMLAHENRQLIVEDAFQTDLINDTRRNEILENLEIQHQDKINQIKFKGSTAAFKFSEAVRKKDVRSALAFGSELTAGVAQQNKTMFDINKTLALANAAVALPDAVISSFRNGGGYPWGLIPAGLMLATGLSQINAIKSTSFGSGGGAPSIAGGGGGGSSTVNTIPYSSAANQDPPEAAQTSEPKNINITIEGNPSAQQTRDLIDAINEQVDDGYNINARVVA